MTKKELRNIYKKQRQYFEPNERLSLEANIFANFREGWDLSGKTVHLYLPIKRLYEIDTFPLLQDKEVRWVVSKSDFNDHSLRHYAYTHDMVLKENEFNIPEPETGEEVDVKEIDMVITPMLCFDLKGYRIGYGKGFYDRFLSLCRPDVQKIGLCLFEAEPAIADVDSHDVRLTNAITPKNVYYF